MPSTGAQSAHCVSPMWVGRVDPESVCSRAAPRGRRDPLLATGPTGESCHGLGSSGERADGPQAAEPGWQGDTGQPKSSARGIHPTQPTAAWPLCAALSRLTPAPRPGQGAPEGPARLQGAAQPFLGVGGWGGVGCGTDRRPPHGRGTGRPLRSHPRCAAPAAANDGDAIPPRYRSGGDVVAPAEGEDLRPAHSLRALPRWCRRTAPSRERGAEKAPPHRRHRPSHPSPRRPALGTGTGPHRSRTRRCRPPHRCVSSRRPRRPGPDGLEC
ncbi:hypothetical protein SUDANB132_00211 [Streptomyces sp. enrichment culture]